MPHNDSLNNTPEQNARNTIERQLTAAGWVVQKKRRYQQACFRRHSGSANFKDWVISQHSGTGEKFTEEQMNWLRMIKEHIASNIHIEPDDLNVTPFDAHGGRVKMWQL